MDDATTKRVKDQWNRLVASALTGTHIRADAVWNARNANPFLANEFAKAAGQEMDDVAAEHVEALWEKHVTNAMCGGVTRKKAIAETVRANPDLQYALCTAANWKRDAHKRR